MLVTEHITLFYWAVLLPCMLECGGVGTFSRHLPSQRKEFHPSQQQGIVAHAELGCGFVDDQLRRKKALSDGRMDRQTIKTTHTFL